MMDNDEGNHSQSSAVEKGQSSSDDSNTKSDHQRDVAQDEEKQYSATPLCICPVCDKVLASMKSLFGHFGRSHKMSIDQDLVKYVCPFCDDPGGAATDVDADGEARYRIFEAASELESHVHGSHPGCTLLSTLTDNPGKVETPKKSGPSSSPSAPAAPPVEKSAPSERRRRSRNRSADAKPPLPSSSSRPRNSRSSAPRQVQSDPLCRCPSCPKILPPQALFGHFGRVHSGQMEGVAVERFEWKNVSYACPFCPMGANGVGEPDIFGTVKLLEAHVISDHPNCLLLWPNALNGGIPRSAATSLSPISNADSTQSNLATMPVRKSQRKAGGGRRSALASDEMDIDVDDDTESASSSPVTATRKSQRSRRPMDSGTMIAYDDICRPTRVGTAATAAAALATDQEEYAEEEEEAKKTLYNCPDCDKRNLTKHGLHAHYGMVHGGKVDMSRVIAVKNKANRSRNKKRKTEAGQGLVGDAAASRGPWTDEEHAAFLEGHRRLGNRWKRISVEYVPTRDAKQIGSHALNYFTTRGKWQPGDRTGRFGTKQVQSSDSEGSVGGRQRRPKREGSIKPRHGLVGKVISAPTDVDGEEGDSVTVDSNVSDSKDENNNVSDKGKDKDHEDATSSTSDDGNSSHCIVCFEGGQIVCCSKCPRAYHPKCLAKEGGHGRGGNPYNIDLLPNDWQCNRCKKDGIVAGGEEIPQHQFGNKKIRAAYAEFKECSGYSYCCTLLSNILDILNKLKKYDYGYVFSEPVDVDDVPDYLSVVKTPMDYGTIGDRLEGGSYVDLIAPDDIHEDEINTMEDILLHVLRDIERVHHNCRLYNKKGSSIYRIGDVHAEKWNAYFGQYILEKLPGNVLRDLTVFRRACEMELVTENEQSRRQRKKRKEEADKRKKKAQRRKVGENKSFGGTPSLTSPSANQRKRKASEESHLEEEEDDEEAGDKHEDIDEDNLEEQEGESPEEKAKTGEQQDQEQEQQEKHQQEHPQDQQQEEHQEQHRQDQHLQEQQQQERKQQEHQQQEQQQQYQEQQQQENIPMAPLSSPGSSSSALLLTEDQLRSLENVFFTPAGRLRDEFDELDACNALASLLSDENPSASEGGGVCGGDGGIGFDNGELLRVKSEESQQEHHQNDSEYPPHTAAAASICSSSPTAEPLPPTAALPMTSSCSTPMNAAGNNNIVDMNKISNTIQNLSVAYTPTSDNAIVTEAQAATTVGSSGSGNVARIQYGTTFQRQWYERLNELKKYKVMHGTAVVSASKSDKLYHWRLRQRKRYHLTLFRMPQVKKEEPHGWAAEDKKDKQWLLSLPEMKGVFALGALPEDGNCAGDTPNPFIVKEKDVEFDDMTVDFICQRHQEQLYCPPLVPAEFLVMGQHSSRHSNSLFWDECLEELRFFQGEHGHTIVPRDFPHNSYLAVWVEIQRAKYLLQITGLFSGLTGSQMLVLDELDLCDLSSLPAVNEILGNGGAPDSASSDGITLKTPQRGGGGGKKTGGVKAKTREDSASWITNASDFREWYEKLSPEEKRRALQLLPRANWPLYSWCWRQCNATSSVLCGTPNIGGIGMSAKKLSTLAKAKFFHVFPYNVRDNALVQEDNYEGCDAFDSTFRVLENFSIKYGSTRIPDWYSCDTAFRMWVSALENGLSEFVKGEPCVLSTDQIERLILIGFCKDRDGLPNLSRGDVIWLKMFMELKRHRELFGACHISVNFPRLHQWLEEQKELFQLSRKGTKDMMNSARLWMLIDAGVDFFTGECLTGADNLTRRDLKEFELLASSPVESYPIKNSATNQLNHGWHFQRDSYWKNHDFRAKLDRFKAKHGHSIVLASDDRDLYRWFVEKRGKVLLSEITSFGSSEDSGSNEICSHSILPYITGQHSILRYVMAQQNEDIEVSDGDTTKVDQSLFLWLHYCERLMMFKARKGHCKIPQGYPDKPLLQWLAQQRQLIHLYSENQPTELLPVQLKILHSLGVHGSKRHAMPPKLSSRALKRKLPPKKNKKQRLEKEKSKKE